MCVDRVGCVGRMCLWMAGGRTTRRVLVECGGADRVRDVLITHYFGSPHGGCRVRVRRGAGRQ